MISGIKFIKHRGFRQSRPSYHQHSRHDLLEISKPYHHNRGQDELKMFCWAVVIPLAVVVVVSNGGLVAAETASMRCPDDYILNTAEHNKTCFRVYEDRLMTQSAARDVCKTNVTDGVLLQVESIESNEMVAGVLTRWKRYWIGVTKNENEEAIADATESPVPFEAPWAWGEPSHHRSKEWCVEMIGNRRGEWNDKRCNKKRPFVCQTPALEVLKECEKEKEEELKEEEKEDTPTIYDNLSCDFETECKWRLDNWSVVTNDSIGFDHTLNSSHGHFVIAPLKMHTLYTSELEINVTKYSCISFYYRGLNPSVITFDGYNESVMEGRDISRRKEPSEWGLYMATVSPFENREFALRIGGANDIPKAIDDVAFRPIHC